MKQIIITISVYRNKHDNILKNAYTKNINFSKHKKLIALSFNTNRGLV